MYQDPEITCRALLSYEGSNRDTRVSRPSRVDVDPSPRFFHLRPVYSLGRCTYTQTHTHTARYELVVRQSIAYVPCSPNFRRCCRNETGPECIRLRLKYLPICSEPFGRFPFPRAGPMAAEARTFHGKLVEASDRFRI